MSKDTKIFIQHILENIERIESFSKTLSEDELFKDVLRQYAIIRAVELIGESAKNLPNSFKKEHPSIAWKKIIGTRDKVIHQYFGIDLKVIWEIVKKDIPKLKEEILNVLKEYKKLEGKKEKGKK